MAGVNEASTTNAPLWRSPWVWAFALGVLVLPWFRPWLSRIPDPPPSLGVSLDGVCGEGGADVRAVVVCGGPSARCDAAMQSNALKAYWIARQSDVHVSWYTLGALSEGKAAVVAELSGVQMPRCDAPLAPVEEGLGIQRMIQHPLEHIPQGDPTGSVVLVDASGEIRGIMNPAQPLGRRELASRLAWLQSESLRSDQQP